MNLSGPFTTLGQSAASGPSTLLGQSNLPGQSNLLAQSTVLGQSTTFVEGDLSTRGHVFIAVATALALVFILRLLRRRRMGGKYAVLWTAAGLSMGVLAVWPGLLTLVSEFAGVHYPPALFLLITTGFLFVVVIQFSYELTRLEDRSRTLAEEVALLRNELEIGLGRAGLDGGGDPTAGAPASPGPPVDDRR